MLDRKTNLGSMLVRLPTAASAAGGSQGGHRTISNPTSDDWDRLRAVFTHYYRNYKGKGLPLRAVRIIMARKYGFTAT